MAADETTATFSFDLETEDSQKSAESMASELEKLRTKMTDSTAELRGLNQALRNLKGGGNTATALVKDLKEKIAAQKATLAGAQASFIKLGGSMKELGKKDGALGLKELTAAAKSGGGPIGGMLGKVGELRTMLGTAGMAGAAIAGAAAVVALTVALTAAVVALGAYGLAQANAARAERLMLEGLVKIPNWFGLAADKASYLQDTITQVTGAWALGRDKVSGYATELYRMGLRGQNLKDALEATTIASSAAGEGYAGLVKGMVAGAAYAGGSVKKVADTIRARFGGIAKAQTLDLNVQLSKLKESFSQLFTGLKIEGFLTALNQITQLFSQNTVSGKALKALLEGMFNPILHGIEKLAPMAKAFFLGMVLAALDVGIAMQKLRIAFEKTFHKKLRLGMDDLTAAFEAGKIAGYALLAVVGLLGAAIAVSFALLAVPWIALAGAIYAVGVSVWYTLIVPFKTFAKVVGEALGDATFFLVHLDWGKAASNLIDGLVNGIKNGVGRVVAAVKDLGKSVLGAWDSATDSHSPSRKMIQRGRGLAQGGTIGVKAEAPRMAQAVGDMGSALVSMPFADRRAPAAAPAGRGGSTVTIAELHYHSRGREHHEEDARDFRTKLSQELESVGIQLGLVPS